MLACAESTIFTRGDAHVGDFVTSQVGDKKIGTAKPGFH